MKDLVIKVNFCKSKIYNMIKDDEFPKPKKDGKTSYWYEHDIDKWLTERENLEPS